MGEGTNWLIVAADKYEWSVNPQPANLERGWSNPANGPSVRFTP
jgi:hypothetical protein